MIAYISLFISIICLILLTVLLIRIKKIFSTQNIMKKVEALMNKRITEINRITFEDTQIVKESSKTIRNLIAKTDEDIKKYQEAAARLRNLLHQAEETENLNNSETKSIIPEAEDYVYKNSTMVENINKDSSSIVSYRHLMKNKVTRIEEKKEFNAASSDFITFSKPKKNDFSSKIKKMSDAGYSVDEIADNLGCSITEVQYVLDLGL